MIVDTLYTISDVVSTYIFPLVLIAGFVINLATIRAFTRIQVNKNLKLILLVLLIADAIAIVFYFPHMTVIRKQFDYSNLSFR